MHLPTNQRKEDKNLLSPLSEILKQVSDIVGNVKNFQSLIALALLVILLIVVMFTYRSELPDQSQLFLTSLLIILIIVLIVGFLAAKGKLPSSEISTMKELKDRSQYIQAMIDSAKAANERIWLSVHTLKPSSEHRDIGMLQELLSRAKVDGKDVRIIAPASRDRVKAAYELSIEKKIQIKMLSFLSVEDVRYMIIDNEISVISLDASEKYGTSDRGAVIISEQLNRLLQKHFEERWDHESAMDYNTFLAKEARLLLNPTQPTSRKKIGDELHVSKSEIERILPFARARKIVKKKI